MQTKTFTVSLADLTVFVREILVELEQSPVPAVLALDGDLGTGKTTFVQTLARELGVAEAVTSPTFTIMRRYETTDRRWQQLVHIDAYRIDDLTELAPLKFDEILVESTTLICIEWATQIQEALPEHTYWLRFSSAKAEDERTVQFQKPVA